MVGKKIKTDLPLPTAGTELALSSLRYQAGNHRTRGEVLNSTEVTGTRRHPLARQLPR